MRNEELFRINLYNQNAQRFPLSESETHHFPAKGNILRRKARIIFVCRANEPHIWHSTLANEKILEGKSKKIGKNY